MAKPLTKLTGLLTFKWTIDQQEAFDQLKAALASQPVIAIPRDNASYQLEVDLLD